MKTTTPLRALRAPFAPNSVLRIWKCGSLRKTWRKGVAAIEFALIAPVFFFLFIGVTEMSLMLFVQHVMESSSYNASRVAKTGYIATGKTQLETVMEVINRQFGGLSPLVDPTKIVVTTTAYGNLSQIGQPEQGIESLGAPEQVVVHTISYPWKFFTPMIANLIGDQNGIITLTSRIVVRNEPYDLD